MTTAPLTGRTIVVPESRELDLFSEMLERQGASVVRCPMVKILPLEDSADLDAWIDRLAQADDLILYTGEGLRRIAARAEETGRLETLTTALGRVRRIVRGPKPVAALRKLGLTPDISAEQPTTEGLVAALSPLDFTGRTVALQLYPGNDGAVLRDLIEARGGRVDPVTPYRYADDEQDRRVGDVLTQMAAGGVDLIAFTSSPQVRRLTDVAAHMGLADDLTRALTSTRIAAVGPIVAEAVEAAGGVVAIQPPASFHLKPLVAEIVKALGTP